MFFEKRIKQNKNRPIGSVTAMRSGGGDHGSCGEEGKKKKERSGTGGFEVKDRERGGLGGVEKMSWRDMVVCVLCVCLWKSGFSLFFPNGSRLMAGGGYS